LQGGRDPTVRAEVGATNRQGSAAEDGSDRQKAGRHSVPARSEKREGKECRGRVQTDVGQPQRLLNLVIILLVEPRLIVVNDDEFGSGREVNRGLDQVNPREEGQV
jgi:hypothetical protein